RMSKPINETFSPEEASKGLASSPAVDEVKPSSGTKTTDTTDARASREQTAPSVIDKSSPKVSEPESAGCLASLAETMSSIRSIVTNGLILSLLIALALTAVSEVWQRPTVLDPIEVPKELADRGYSSGVVAERLNDEI